MKTILCPLCGKEIGKRISDGGHDSGGLGYVELYRSKYDYRRASHTWWNSKYKNGILCKTCAKEKFPSGQYWVIVYIEWGKESLCAGGDSGDPWKYTTEKAAQKKADELSERFGHKYTVEKREI